MSESCLHPDRIRQALRALRGERLDTHFIEDARAMETAIAAIQLVQKSQQALGLTSNVADAGAALVKLMGALRK